MSGDNAPAPWHPAKRWTLRFAAVYAVLYSFPFPLTWVPVVSGWFGWFRDFEWWAIDLLAVHVFGIAEPLDRPWGSGDPTHSYIRLLLHLGLALLGALLWLLLDRTLLSRKPPYDAKLAAWLHIFVRYSLALTMLSYGFAKVFPNQFPEPMLTRLLAPFGDSSPMNVLWTFMGVSAPYVIFGGASEVVAGLLLLLRRTATLGALVAIGVMTNVVALNFMYDVPVKLYSSHLLLFAVALTLPDAGRLLRVLLFNRPTERRDLSYPRVPKWAYVVKALAIGYVLVTMISGGISRFDSQRQRPALWGIWDVETFRLDGEDLPPLRSDPVRWQNLVIERDTFGIVFGMDDVRWNVSLEHDAEAGTLKVSTSARWTYALEAPDTLLLRGEFQRTHKNQPWEATSAANPETPREPQLELRLERVALATPEGGSDARAEPAEVAEPEAGGEAEREDEETTSEPVPVELHGRWRLAALDIIGDTYIPRRRSLPFGWNVIDITSDQATVAYPDGQRETYRLTFQPAGDGRTQPLLQLSSSTTFTVEQPYDGKLVLTGERAGRQLEIELLLRDLEEFLVRRRGFNWINEIPLNRY